MKTFLAKIVEIYMIYSDAIHSILPSKLGDIAEVVIDLGVVFVLVLVIGKSAFKSKNGSF